MQNDRALLFTILQHNTDEIGTRFRIFFYVIKAMDRLVMLNEIKKKTHCDNSIGNFPNANSFVTLGSLTSHILETCFVECL